MRAICPRAPQDASELRGRNDAAHESVDQAKSAKTLGFFTIMVYIAAPTADESVRRVTQRAKAGGHGAPEEELRGIYAASVGNLPAAIGAFDIVRCYDSITASGEWPVPVLVAESQNGVLRIVSNPVPLWLAPAIE